jgi:TM2 domain-containing membrane protein YozV
LQLLPIVGGLGRIYLGYTALGVLQIVASFCGIGYIWSIVDGILMLTGQVKYDGYGRSLPE